MHKELVIVISIVCIIIIGHIVTQNNTRQTVNSIKEEFADLRKDVIEKDVNSEKVKEQTEKIEKIWKSKYQVMAYYIEHDELEKVETELVKMKADMEIKEYKTAVEYIDSCVFILEHIKDKNALKIINVF